MVDVLGKTARLINQIYRDKECYDVQILMGTNYTSLEELKKQIKKNAKVKICLSFNKLRQLLATNKKVRLYVDEFLFSTAFVNNFSEIKKLYETVLLDGYFSSSLNSKHLDPLCELQKLNHNNKLMVINTTNIE